MAKKISTTKDRLAEMMSILGITASDIVRKTGINKSTLSNYINGKRTAVQDQLSLIADPYGIDPAWLMGYDVPMKAPVSIDDYSPDFVDRALDIYKRIDDLPAAGKEELENYLLYLQAKFGHPR